MDTYLIFQVRLEPVAKLRVEITPRLLVVDVGDTGLLRCNAGGATGSADTSYSWYKDGLLITAAGKVTIRGQCELQLYFIIQLFEGLHRHLPAVLYSFYVSSGIWR